MARTLTPQDCHVLMNLLVKEATGQDSAIQIVDSSSFTSAGETVLATGVENTLNALSVVLGRTFMAVRPYEAKLKIMNAISTDGYTSRMRKISFYAREAQESGDWNTQLYAENLKNGEEAIQNSGKTNTKSMWEQNQPVPLEMNFAGRDVWEESTTIYEYQLKSVFRSESEFSDFVGAIMVEKGNDIERRKEAFNRMTLLNRMAGQYDFKDTVPAGVVNLTKAFNDEYGTAYTSAELRTTYLDQFLAFFVSTFKLYSDLMAESTSVYHWVPEKTGYTLLRHTPKDRQRAILYAPLFIRATAQVMPEVFNDQYLKIENGERVNYWQNFNEPSKISVTPAIPDPNTGLQKKGDAVSLDYVVGCLYDVDALMVDFQMEDAQTTPLEARKRYRNIWWSFSKNAINDFTENFILFTMEDA